MTHTIPLTQAEVDQRFSNEINRAVRRCRIGKVTRKQGAWIDGGIPTLPVQNGNWGAILRKQVAGLAEANHYLDRVQQLAYNPNVFPHFMEVDKSHG